MSDLSYCLTIYCMPDQVLYTARLAWHWNVGALEYEGKDKTLRGGRGERLAEGRLAQMGWAEGWPRITAKLLFQTYFEETSI